VERNNSSMGIPMKGVIKMDDFMDKEFIIGLMELFIKENSRKG